MSSAVFLRNYLQRRVPAVLLHAIAPVRPFIRSFSAKQQGLQGVSVTKGSPALKQAVAEQRWVVGDADSFKKCDPCEQGGKPLDRVSALNLLQQTPEWVLSDDGASISRSWQAKVCNVIEAPADVLLLTRRLRTSKVQLHFCTMLLFLRKTRDTIPTSISSPTAASL
jgi:hypothetical protein